jgi:Putative peptidoglycan binding domain
MYEAVRMLTNIINKHLTILAIFALVAIGVFSNAAMTPTALADTGAAFTLNDIGVQTVTYNGVNYAAPSIYGAQTNYINDIEWMAPSGATSSEFYDWTATSPLEISNAQRATGPGYFQQAYSAGQPHSVTLKVALATTDTRTVKVDIYVTNNDTTDTINKIDLTNFLPIQLPGTVQQLNWGIPISVGGTGLGDQQVLFRSGDWGSFALWPASYTDNAEYSSNPRSDPQTAYDSFLSNYSSSEPSSVTTNPIPPGQTWHYAYYIRFGSSTDTMTTLAPEVGTSFRAAFPSLVNWPDRRPIARWFVSQSNDTSAINPGGYMMDPTLDVSSSTLFDARVLSQTDDIIAYMNTMNPRPQGLIVWDLEGQEYPGFVYVGHPSLLPVLSPPMNAVADEMFAKLRNAGYKIGVTLRPDTFGTGTTVPASCNYDPNPNPYLTTIDAFIKTDAPFGQKIMACTANGTYAENQGAYPQTTDSANEAYNNLSSEITYAKNRWGMTIFYVDSTWFTDGHQLDFQIFRRLQQAFPDVLLLPENETYAYYGASAPYNGVPLNPTYTPELSKLLYPQAFQAIEVSQSNYSDPTVHNALVQSLRSGNIFFVDVGWPTPTNAQTLQIYRDAGITNPPTLTLSSTATTLSVGQSITLTANFSAATGDTLLDTAINEVPPTGSEYSAVYSGPFWGGTTTTVTSPLTYTFTPTTAGTYVFKPYADSSQHPNSQGWTTDSSKWITVTVTAGSTSPTTPPTITITAPIGILAASTTSTILSVTTNEAATCAWATTAGQAFASMTTFTTTGGTSHSIALSGLINSTAYTRYVKCKDTAGNISTDTTVPFSVAAAAGGTTPPTLTLSSTATTLSVGQSITLTANFSAATGDTLLDTAINIVPPTGAEYSVVYSGPFWGSGTTVMSPLTYTFTPTTAGTYVFKPYADSTQHPNSAGWTTDSSKWITVTVTASAGDTTPPVPTGSGSGASPSANAGGSNGQPASSLPTAASAKAALLQSLYAELATLEAELAALQAGHVASSGTTTAGACAISITRTLALGSTGSDVTQLQRLLSQQYSNFSPSYVTGYFGPLTQAAVQAFQRDHTIVSSGTPQTTGWGIVGPQTRQAIAAVCGQG